MSKLSASLWWRSLASVALACALTACDSSGAAETTPTPTVDATLRSTDPGCVELVRSGASVFHGCASDFEGGAQVVSLDLENSLYVVYVATGSVVDGVGYSTLGTQGPFALVTLTDKSRTIYEIDFAVDRDSGRVTCRHQGVIGFLECA